MGERYGFHEEIESLGKYQIENTNVEGDITTITMKSTGSVKERGNKSGRLFDKLG